MCIARSPLLRAPIRVRTQIPRVVSTSPCTCVKTPTVASLTAAILWLTSARRQSEPAKRQHAEPAPSLEPKAQLENEGALAFFMSS